MNGNKKPFLQRKWVWIVIVLIIGIGFLEIKSSFKSKQKEVNIEKILKDKVKVPNPLFKTKDEVKAEFERIGLKPKFVVSNFDDTAVAQNRFLRKDECNQLSDGSGATYLDSKEVKIGHSGYYAKKGDEIIIGYSDHDFDGTKNTTEDTSSKKEISSSKTLSKESDKKETKSKKTKNSTPEASSNNDINKSEIDVKIATDLEQAKGWAFGKLDRDGNPVDNGEPLPDWRWSIYIDKIEKDDTSGIVVYVNNDFLFLSNSDKKSVLNGAQSLASVPIGEAENWGPSDYQRGLFVEVLNGTNPVGHSKVLDVKDFYWEK